MTPTLAQSTLFATPASSQLRAQIYKTTNDTTAKNIPDALNLSAIESVAGSIPHTQTPCNPWVVPSKKGHATLLAVAAFHLVLIWNLQGGFTPQVMKKEPVKNLLMVYLPPANSVQEPVKKSLPKTVAVTTSVTKPVMRAVPIAAVIETSIEPTLPSTEPTQMSSVQTKEVANQVASQIIPNPAALPRTIDSGVEYIKAPQPDYPPLAKRAGEQGKVMLRVLVNDKGLPESVELQKSSGSTRLDEAARQAAFRARFKPYMENGKTVAVYVIVPISFQLDN